MELMDEEIRNAVDLEIRRLTEEEEEEVEKKKKLMEERKEIRKTRFKFNILRIKPLEIIHNPDYQDFAENINQIELVIDVTDHYYIYQYWSPPIRSGAGATAAGETRVSSLCKHDDYQHPRDDDDEDMILTSCRSLCNPPQKFKIMIDQGVFAADHTDDHIMSILLRDVVLIFEHNLGYTIEELEDLKRSITNRISEAKAHVLKAKPFPRRVRICVDTSNVAKKYYGSAEAATFAAAMEEAVARDAVYRYIGIIR